MKIRYGLSIEVALVTVPMRLAIIPTID